MRLQASVYIFGRLRHRVGRFHLKSHNGVSRMHIDWPLQKATSCLILSTCCMLHAACLFWFQWTVSILTSPHLTSWIDLSIEQQEMEWLKGRKSARNGFARLRCRQHRDVRSSLRCFSRSFIFGIIFSRIIIRKVFSSMRRSRAFVATFIFARVVWILGTFSYADTNHSFVVM